MSPGLRTAIAYRSETFPGPWSRTATPAVTSIAATSISIWLTAEVSWDIGFPVSLASEPLSPPHAARLVVNAIMKAADAR